MQAYIVSAGKQHLSLPGNMHGYDTHTKQGSSSSFCYLDQMMTRAETIPWKAYAFGSIYACCVVEYIMVFTPYSLKYFIFWDRDIATRVWNFGNFAPTGMLTSRPKFFLFFIFFEFGQILFKFIQNQSKFQIISAKNFRNYWNFGPLANNPISKLKTLVATVVFASYKIPVLFC